jgi:hypothetical protein
MNFDPELHETDADSAADSKLEEELFATLGRIRDEELLERYYREKPYLALAIAAGVGYVIGGGLVTPFSKRFLRLGIKSFLVPAALYQLKDVAERTLSDT